MFWSPRTAAHEAGFAAAMKRLGAEAPALYHMDATRPDRRRRNLGGMPASPAPVPLTRIGHPVNHGFARGEIAATLDQHGLCASGTGGACVSLTSISRPHWGRDLVASERENPAALWPCGIGSTLCATGGCG